MIIKSKNISLISALLVTLCPLFDVVAESDYPKTRDERKNDEIGSMVGGGGIIFTPSKTKNESTKQQIHSVINIYGKLLLRF